MTTTAMTPAQIHDLGLSEVARIGAAMDKVAADAGYPDRAAFVQRMRTDPAFYARTRRSCSTARLPSRSRSTSGCPS